MIYAKELGVEEYIAGSDYVFTSELKVLSGAVYHKIVYIFRLCYAKILTEKLGYPIPLFIDSPGGREIESESVDSMMKILDRDFKGHQVFIASIIKFQKGLDGEVVIEMDGTKFNPVSPMETYLKNTTINKSEM